MFNRRRVTVCVCVVIPFILGVRLVDNTTGTGRSRDRHLDDPHSHLFPLATDGIQYLVQYIEAKY